MLRRVISRNKGIDSSYLYVGLFFITLAVIAFASGKAINFGTYGANSGVLDSKESTGDYTFLALAQFILGILFLIRSYVYCPAFSDSVEKLSEFKNGRPVVYRLTLFLGLPLVAVILLILASALLG